jgi:hypothetical protein
MTIGNLFKNFFNCKNDLERLVFLDENLQNMDGLSGLKISCSAFDTISRRQLHFDDEETIFLAIDGLIHSPDRKAGDVTQNTRLQPQK